MKEKGNKRKEDSKSERDSLNFLNTYKGLEYLTLKGHIERKRKGGGCKPLTWRACVNRRGGERFGKGKTLLMATRDKGL